MEILLKYFPAMSATQVQQFSELAALYKEWNSQINVISRKDIDGLYEKHVLHSLSIAAFCPFPAGSSVIDIGTGGGFPGIPLAIMFPNVEFLLLDSIAKKLKVVEAVTGSIGLKNVSTFHGRAEELSGRKTREPSLKFDSAVSRAVAPIKDLWHWAKPLLRKRQSFYEGLICLKGGDLQNEIRESGTKPSIRKLSELYSEPYFLEKFLLQIR